MAYPGESHQKVVISANLHSSGAGPGAAIN